MAVAFHSSVSSADLFLDGAIVGSGSIPQPLPTSTNLFLGRDSKASQYYLNGRLDEISIWTKALSGNEILALMSCRLAGSEQSLAAYFSFDLGTPNDSTGGGHNGTLAGDAQIMPLASGDPVHAGCLPLIFTQGMLTTDRFPRLTLSGS